MISEIIEQLSSYLDISIIAETKDSSQSTYPCGGYSIKEINFDSPHQRIRKQETKENDMVEIQHYYRSEITVLLCFYNRSTTQDGSALQQIITLSQDAWIWLNNKGRELCNNHNLVLYIKPKEKEKKVEEEIGNNIYRIGFEFVLKSTLKHMSEIEAITGIDYTIVVKH